MATPGDSHASSALRSAFWRHYDFLGRLTLLSAFGSAALILTAFGLFRLLPLLGDNWARSCSVLAALSVSSALAAGTGRAAFGVFLAGKFDWKDVPRGARRFTVRVFLLSILLALLTAVSLNAFLVYLHAAGTVAWAYLPAFLAASILAASALSSVWVLPVLFFRNDPAWKALWRSLLLVLGHPAETLALTALTAMWLFLYYRAPVTGLLLGLPTVLAVPCAMLEKIQWGYTITFEGIAPAWVLARWERESERGWREFFKPWEGR